VGGQDLSASFGESEEVPSSSAAGKPSWTALLLLDLGAERNYVTKPSVLRSPGSRARHSGVVPARRPASVDQVYFSMSSVDFLKMEVIPGGSGGRLDGPMHSFKLLKYFSQIGSLDSRTSCLSDVWGYHS